MHLWLKWSETWLWGRWQFFRAFFWKKTILAWCLPCMSSKHGKFTRQKGCTWWLFPLFFGDVYRAYSRKTLTHHGFYQGPFVESATDPCLALHGWSSRRVPTLTTHPHSISVCKPKRRLNGIVSQGDFGHFWGPFRFDELTDNADTDKLSRQ